jgi:hypothetical protein
MNTRKAKVLNQMGMTKKGTTTKASPTPGMDDDPMKLNAQP